MFKWGHVRICEGRGIAALRYGLPESYFRGTSSWILMKYCTTLPGIGVELDGSYRLAAFPFTERVYAFPGPGALFTRHGQRRNSLHVVIH